MKSVLSILFLFSAAYFFPANAEEPTHKSLRQWIGKPGLYTLVNLHPEEDRLYAVNYQRRMALIPLCTEIVFTRLSSNKLLFRATKTGKDYEYRNHDAAAESFPKHLMRFFGTECNKEKVEALSEIDQDGIYEGVPLVGMTKQGVYFALGHPPRHVTPDLEAPRWTYWSNRFNRFVVHFDRDGIVTEIQH